jgi:phage tail-like protein
MPAAESAPKVSHQRHFEVTIPGLNLTVGYFTQVSGFSSQLDVLEYPEGGRNDFVHRLPTRIKQGNITLKRGYTGEDALLKWFNKTVVEAQPENLSITHYDPESETVTTWSFANAYPVKWTGSDMNAGGNEIPTETLEIAHSGMTVQ